MLEKAVSHGLYQPEQDDVPVFLWLEGDFKP